jgi:thiol-disulfide isomerase/thioredoxin
MKYLIFFCPFLLFSNHFFSQQRDYKLNITNRNECNKVIFERIIWDSLYYNIKIPKLIYKNSKYTAQGKINFPQAFKIYSESCNENYGIFILQQRENTFKLKSTDRSLFPQADEDFKNILNNFEIEKDKIYKNISNDVKSNHNIFPSEKKIYYDQSISNNEDKRDSLIYEHTNKTKDPYLILWYLIYKIENDWYYSSWYKKIFDSLPTDTKKSYAGKRLSNKIQTLEKIQIGEKFPLEIIAKNSIFKNTNKKYFLVDFWFSHCGPCLNDFPKYKEVYKQYKDKGLEIIGISTDQTKNVNDWKKVIKEKDLLWIHFLDENGTESKKYNINAFPTTFLLDSEGVIIKKNISPEELENFLEKNL